MAQGSRGPHVIHGDKRHYHKVVVALSETIRLMQEIEEVIEQHGGWPGAFQTGEAYSTESGEHLLKVAEPKATYGTPKNRGKK